MNEMRELKYRNLLGIRDVINDSLIKARCNFNNTYEKYGKDTILYKISHREVRELETAKKEFKLVVDVLRKNSLYINGK